MIDYLVLERSNWDWPQYLYDLPVQYVLFLIGHLACWDWGLPGPYLYVEKEVEICNAREGARTSQVPGSKPYPLSYFPLDTIY